MNRHEHRADEGTEYRKLVLRIRDEALFKPSVPDGYPVYVPESGVPTTRAGWYFRRVEFHPAPFWGLVGRGRFRETGEVWEPDDSTSWVVLPGEIPVEEFEVDRMTPQEESVSEGRAHWVLYAAFAVCWILVVVTVARVFGWP